MIIENYWDNYYSKKKYQTQSNFAEFIALHYFEKDKLQLCDIGCGNGRDSIYFHSKGVEVTGVDLAKDEIDYLNKSYPKIDFICADISNLNTNKKYDIIYSRFSLHSIDKEKEKNLLIWISNSLLHNGLVCIECRGLKNELYGKGLKIEGEEHIYFYEDHYRRFIDYEKLITELNHLGFIIEYSEESTGFSPTKLEDQTFIRIIARLN